MNLTSRPTARRVSDLGPAEVRSERPLGEWMLGPLVATSSLSSIHLARPAAQPAEGYSYIVKLLNSRWQRSERALAMFAAEAQVGRSVAHPNLVAVLQARPAGSPPFLVMPRYRGATLAAMARGGRRLPLAAVVWTLRQAAEALSALHEAGWLHGDVKPHNLVLDEQGHVTLLDLGFVQRLNEPAGVADRPLLGTLRYLPPEMIRSSVQADQRSDIYSLGAVAYELIAGRPPFEGRSAAELAEQHCYARPPAIRKFAPSTPDSLVRLVDAMLAKQGFRRPESKEVVDTLVRLEVDLLGDALLVA